jgi:hypothetical protein
MALVTRAQARGRRFVTGDRLRAWWALRLQARRRAWASGPVETPGAPVITSAWSQWGTTEAGWADAYLRIIFEHGAFPVATFEVWGWDINNPLQLLDVIPSAAVVDPYHRECVVEDPNVLHYKVRYRSGEVVGPFSNEVTMIIELEH